MDEQRNGTPSAPRRRRAAVQQTDMMNEQYVEAQPEVQQAAAEPETPVQHKKPVYVPMDAEAPVRKSKGKKKKKRKSGSGCLVGIIALLLVVVALLGFLLVSPSALSSVRDVLSGVIQIGRASCRERV